MMANGRGRSSRLRSTVASPVHATTAPAFLLPAPSSLLPVALMLGLAVAAHAQNPPLPPPAQAASALQQAVQQNPGDRKSTRLNSSHVAISYAVFCLKKKNI